jgi:hypothetical protein
MQVDVVDESRFQVSDVYPPPDLLGSRENSPIPRDTLLCERLMYGII